MDWIDSGKEHDIPRYIKESLDEEYIEKLYARYRKLVDDKSEEVIIDEYFFYPEGSIFEEYICIDRRVVRVCVGPQPTSCYGPWDDQYYNVEEFSIDDTDFDKINSLIKEYLELSDEDFIDKFEE